jgi:short-subunit dehydrogenase
LDIQYIQCDISSWKNLSDAFKVAGDVDIAIANAGISESESYFQDKLDAEGNLIEPNTAVIDVNLRGTVLFTKLAIWYMRKKKTGGSVVITSSATAYAPEQNLPVYSATKLAVSA